MAKQFPAESEWQAPWEKNGTEFNEDMAKHLIYNLQKSEFNLEADLASTNRELTGAKRAAEEAATGSEKLKGEALFGRKAKIAADHNIPLSRAKWLTGETPDEIEASAKEYVEEFGTEAPKGSETPPGDEEQPPGDKGGDEQPGDEPGDDGLTDYFQLRQQPVPATALSTGAGNGTADEGRTRPAESVAEARKALSFTK